MKDTKNKILEQARNKIENSDNNIKHIIEQQGNDYVRFWKKTVRGIGALSLIILVIGLWQISPMIFMQPTADYNATNPVLVAQTTDIPTATPEVIHHKPATITNNEIKNTEGQTMDKDTHTMLAKHNTATLPTADAPQPDIIATAPIEQEHIPVLLAENETQIEIEQNLVAKGNNDNISTSPVYTSELLAFDNTDINNIDNEQYWQLAEFDTFCNTRCTDMQVVETITRTLI